MHVIETHYKSNFSGPCCQAFKVQFEPNEKLNGIYIKEKGSINGHNFWTSENGKYAIWNLLTPPNSMTSECEQNSGPPDQHLYRF